MCLVKRDQRNGPSAFGCLFRVYTKLHPPIDFEEEKEEDEDNDNDEEDEDEEEDEEEGFIDPTLGEMCVVTAA